MNKIFVWNNTAGSEALIKKIESSPYYGAKWAVSFLVLRGISCQKFPQKKKDGWFSKPSVGS